MPPKIDDSRRKQLGIPRQLQQANSAKPHPSLGGSVGYDQHYRQNQIEQYNNNQQTDASVKYIKKWIVEGVEGKVPTGNKQTQQLTGEHQVLLLQYREIYPRASADEVRAYIANNAVVQHIFSRVDISIAETRIGLTHKRASTTAYQALTPRNILRRQLFWTRPPPLGVFGVPVAQLLDMDETAIFITSANRPYGKSFSTFRVRDAGPYGHTEKWTLILAVDASGFIHHRFNPVGGTTTATFDLFIEGLLQRLPAGGGMRTLMWDNLSSHFGDVTANRILTAGHRIVARPCYNPGDAPIEYIFNQIELAMRRNLHNLHSDADLIAAVNAAIASLNGFAATFTHCGYI